MKILPLQTFNPNHRTNLKQDCTNNANRSIKSAPPPSAYTPLVLRDTTYNIIQINKNKPVFTGAIEKATLMLSKQIPLEERLADAFSFMKHGDLVITGKNIKDAQKSVIESIGKVKNVIKRAFFIEDDNFNGTLAFTKNSFNETEVINANPGRLFLTTDGKEYYLDAHDSFFVIPGDSLKYDGSILNIKDKPKVDLSFHRFAYAKAFDFQQDANEMIMKQNKKSLMQLFQEKKPVHKVMFSDVAGQDDIINELKEGILYPLRKPRAYENMDLTHGFILTGPPGTGKTYVANALRNEAGMNGRYLNGLELESKWVGESEKAWRELFDEAIENQPYLMFIDEFDAVARARGGSDQYGDKVVNQILTLMTDIDDNKHDVFVLAATNHFDALDPAITRSGRFGKHLQFKLPDLDATGKIFDIHAKNKPLSENLSKDKIVKRMFDLKASGADIKRLINDAYQKGYRRAGILDKLDKNILSDADLDAFRITDEDFNSAIDAFSQGKAGRRPIGFTKG